MRGERVESIRRRVVAGRGRIGVGSGRHARGVADIGAYGRTRVVPGAAASPAHTHSAAADPSAPATASARPKSSPHSTTSSGGTGSGTHSFTVPPIPGDNVVTAWGSYTKIGTARVKVDMCAKQTGTAFSVGAIALVYDASGASQNIGATILTGPGNTSCVTNTFIIYTAHLKVHAFIGGNNGTIVKTGPVLTIY